MFWANHHERPAEDSYRNRCVAGLPLGTPLELEIIFEVAG